MERERAGDEGGELDSEPEELPSMSFWGLEEEEEDGSFPEAIVSCICG